MVRRIKEIAPRWVALGGGGYDISNVARAWTLAWAVMNGIELKEELPESYVQEAAKVGVFEKKLKEGQKRSSHNERKNIRTEAKRVVHYIKETVFPKILP